MTLDPKNIEKSIAADMAEKVPEAEDAKAKGLEDRTKTKGEVDRKALERAVDAKSALEGLDPWKISIVRRSKPDINPDDWGVSSKEQINTVQKDWEVLGIFKGGSPFYTKLFKELGKSSDEGFLNGLKSDDERIIYRNPLKYPERLKDLGNEDFANAVNFFIAVKKVVADQDVAQQSTEDVLQNRTKEPITTALTNGIRSNYNAIRDAVRNRDWATVGVYAAGAYGLKKLWDMLPDSGGSDGKGSMFNKDLFSKILFGGIAVYAGDKVLKNAGIDVAEKLGLKNAFDDLKDTPLVSFGDYQIPGGEKVDARVLRDAGFMNMGDLQTKLEESKDSGVVNFIDPNQFPSTFSDKFRGLNPSDLKGDDSKGGELAEYRRVGENLYLIAKSLKYAYEKAEMGKRSGLSYEKAVKNDPTLKNSTIFDFMVQLQRHSLNTRESLSIVGTKGAEKIRARLKEVLDVTYDVDSGELKPGYFQGMIKGYPVVIARDANAKELVIFARSDYELAGGTPDKAKAMTHIPLEGACEGAVKTLNLFIDKKMRDLVSNFAKNSKGSVNFTKPIPEYKGGKWYSQLQYDRGTLLSAAPAPMDVTIEAGLTGTSLVVRNMKNEELLVVNNVLDHSKSYGNAVLAEMMNQTSGINFGVLRSINEGVGLQFVDNNPADTNFSFRIPGVTVDGRDEFEIKVSGTAPSLTYEFVDPADEGKLIKSEAFRAKIAESVGKSPALSAPIDQFKGLVDSAPESYIVNFITSVPSWFTEFTIADPLRGIKGRQFTGAIAAGYAKTLIDVQKQTILYKVADSVGKASNFGDIDGKVQAIVPSAVADLNELVRDFSLDVAKKNEGGDDYKADEFDAKVLDKLSTVGLKSNDYKLWYRSFLGKLMARFGGKSEKIAACLRVFAYETTAADDPAQDGADLHAKAPAAGTTDAAWDKAELFRKNAAKAEHVAQKILLRLDTLGDQTIPGPGQGWGIESDPARHTVRHEFIDVSPKLKEEKDYIEFDAYLALSKTDRDLNKMPVMLPKKDCKFNFSLATDKDAFKKYLELINGGVQISETDGVAEIVNCALTETEKEFADTMNAALKKLKDDYPGYKVGPFDELAKTYSVGITKSISKTPNFVIVDYKYKNNEDFNSHINALKIAFSTNKATLTRGMQSAIIKERVLKIVNDQILGNFEEYFEVKTMTKSAADIYYSIKTWIFGNPLSP